jgi:hypothetical protein
MPWIPLRGVAKPESRLASPRRVSPRQATYFLVRARKQAKKRPVYESSTSVTDWFKDMGYIFRVR